MLMTVQPKTSVSRTLHLRLNVHLSLMTLRNIYSIKYPITDASQRENKSLTKFKSGMNFSDPIESDIFQICKVQHGCNVRRFKVYTFKMKIDICTLALKLIPDFLKFHSVAILEFYYMVLVQMEFTQGL